MKKTTSRHIIRFRRWTRKEYAVFSSLGRCVTIGTLRKKVADASLKKQKAGIPVNPERTDRYVSRDDEQEDDLLLRTEPAIRFLPVGETCCSEYGFTDTEPNICGRKDIYISLRLIYFISRYTYDKRDRETDNPRRLRHNGRSLPAGGGYS